MALNALSVPQTTHPKANWIYFIALLCVPLSGICIDLYSPSLPAMADFFNTQKAYVQLTVSAYLIGFSFFQLIAGPLVDAFGRRIPLCIALFTNTAVALLIPHLPSIYAVIAVRVLQGTAVATSSVAARSLIIDLYAHTREIFLKKASIGAIVWGLGPIFAPFIGGYIQHYLNWQANFYIMAFYILLVGFGALIFVVETQKEFQPFRFKGILKNYFTILKNKKFLAYSLSGGPIWGCLVLFATMGPFIIQSALHYSAVVFGNVTLCMGVAWLLGSMLCRMMIVKVSNKMFYFVFSGGLILSAFILVSGLLGYFNLWVVIIPAIPLTVLLSFIFTHHFTNALAIFPKEIGGSANAMNSSIISAVVMLITAIGATQKAQSQVSLGVTYLLMMLLVIGLFVCFLRKPIN